MLRTILTQKHKQELCHFARCRRVDSGGLIPRSDQNYLPVLVVDDAAFDWIKPIPRPPTAPASNPSSTSTGTLSRSAFFTNFAISYSPLGSLLGICCPS